MNFYKLYQGDCRDYLQSFSKKEFDLILTDFPYGVNVDYGKTYLDTEQNLELLVNETMPEFLRVAKRVVLTCGQSNLWKFPKPTWTLAWINKAGNGMNPWGFTCWHPILCYGKDPYLEKCLGSRPDIIFNNETAEKLKHPCPKPTELWKTLLSRVSVDKNDVVLDPFMGSGTTMKACQELGRSCVGIEINPDFCNVIKKRCFGVQFLDHKVSYDFEMCLCEEKSDEV